MHTRTLERKLTLLPIIMLGLGYMAPMAVFSMYGVVTEASHGMLPSAYIVALLAMLFTAFSYGKMVKAYPVAGSAYSYTQKSINGNLGFLVGWAVLLDYILLPMINALQVGIFLYAAMPQIPMWIYIVVFLTFITVVNIFNVSFIAKITGVLTSYQFLIAIIFIVLCIKGLYSGMGLETLFSLNPFYNVDASVYYIFAGASMLALTFLGFDAVTMFAEETIEPKKVLPKAILIITLFGGLLFTTIAYIGHLVVPDYTQFVNIESATFEIAAYIGGSIFSSFFLAGVLTAGLASGIASQMSASRLLFAMGRDGVISQRFFAYLHPKTKTPVFNIVFIGIIALSSLFLSLDLAASIINFGALVAFGFVNISVIAHYFVRGKQRGFIGVINYLILPLLGALVVAWLWLSLDLKSLIIGGVWILIGLFYLVKITNFFKNPPPELDMNEPL